MGLSEQESKIYDKALKFLSVRMHSAAELSQKLARKDFQKESIGRVIQNLVEQGLLNDERAAESYLDSLLSYKTFGYFGIKAKLVSKGFDRGLVERLLEEKVGIEAEEGLARKFLEKKPRTKVSAAQALARKGFRSQVIAKLVPEMEE